LRQPVGLGFWLKVRYVADRDGPVVAGDIEVLEGLVSAAVFGGV
jgi:hypothetical protein